MEQNMICMKLRNKNTQEEETAQINEIPSERTEGILFIVTAASKFPYDAPIHWPPHPTAEPHNQPQVLKSVHGFSRFSFAIISIRHPYG